MAALKGISEIVALAHIRKRGLQIQWQTWGVFPSEAVIAYRNTQAIADC
jgi:hypothetical protein